MMSKIAKCKNCGKKFIRKTGIKNRSYMYCCSNCYWEYHLKDILKGKEK